MTTEEVKKILKNASEAVRAYRLARDKANNYGELLSGGKGIRYDSDGGTHERKGNPVENAYCVLADYQTEAHELFVKMNEARQTAEKLIASVSDLAQREVLTRRYIIGERWEDIAVCMNFSARRIYQIHGYALKNISLNFTIHL